MGRKYMSKTNTLSSYFEFIFFLVAVMRNHSGQRRSVNGLYADNILAIQRYGNIYSSVCISDFLKQFLVLWQFRIHRKVIIGAIHISLY